MTSASRHAADEMFDIAMQRWWAADRRGAAMLFRRTLKVAPQHAGAHSHLGIVTPGSEEAEGSRAALPCGRLAA